MRILAIETSCDETAIALIESTGSKTKPAFSVLSHIVSSQAKLHAEWGGVVPNLAKREHQRNLPTILLKVLQESGIKNKELRKRSTKKNLNSKFIIHNSILEREPELLAKFERYILPLSRPDIDLIAVTQGPGLEPALWVGVNFARALSYLWDIPLLGVNHMEGHILSALFEQDTKRYTLNPIPYPALALLVSGGHTELVLIKKPLQYKIIGETLDDAAGEAFDKVARILELGYPGGPAISQEAEKWETARPLGRPVSKFKLPRPMLNSKDYNFSFSGLKTAALYLVRDLKQAKRSIPKLTPAIAKEFQDAVVDVLVSKTMRAAKEYKVKSIILGGGVAANTELRKRLGEAIRLEMPNTTYYIPDTKQTGDNALMIAESAFFQAKQAKKTAPSKKLRASWKALRPDAAMRLS